MARQKAQSPRQVNHNSDSMNREFEQIYANQMGGSIHGGQSG